MVAGISSLLALADEDDGGGVAGKSDVVHCFFSCSTVDDEDDGGTCLAVVVRLEPSGPKECTLRGECDINSEKDSASAACLPIVALRWYMYAACCNEQACVSKNSNELLEHFGEGDELS